MEVIHPAPILFPYCSTFETVWEWTGKYFRGVAKKINWNKAMKACPRGYRLPTRQEFMALLELEEDSPGKA